MVDCGQSSLSSEGSSVGPTTTFLATTTLWGLNIHRRPHHWSINLATSSEANPSSHCKDKMKPMPKNAMRPCFTSCRTDSALYLNGSWMQPQLSIRHGNHTIQFGILNPDWTGDFFPLCKPSKFKLDQASLQLFPLFKSILAAPVARLQHISHRAELFSWFMLMTSLLRPNSTTSMWAQNGGHMCC